MKRFWSFSATFLVLLLVLSAGGTYLVQNRPLELKIVSVTPELVQIQANTPIKNAKLAQSGIRVETYGADLYLQPEKHFKPGQHYTFDFETITNRFEKVIKNESIGFTVPDQFVYFITNNAELAMYNLQDKKEEILTPEGFLVNEYVVAGSDVYLLGIDKQKQDANVGQVHTIQSLYKWESEKKSLELLLSSDDVFMHGLYSSPDGKLISIYRAQAQSYMVPLLWLYDTTTATWAKYWNTAFGEQSPVGFSPDNAWLLGVDGETGGFALSPAQKSKPVIPIGNYFESIGISASGRFILFKAYPDNDVFAGDPDFVLFDNNGESETIFSNFSFSPLLLSFDLVDDILWFTYSDEKERTQIGNYDIKNKVTNKITNFKDHQNIVSLHKSKYSDVIFYGVRTQNKSIENNENIQSLMDLYFSEANVPAHTIIEYNLTTNEPINVFDGMMLRR